MKKRTIMTTACAAAALALLGTGTVFAAGSIAEKSSIGAGNAINFAFADAGIDPVSATDVEADFDYEQGQFIYDVEFTANNTEYDYWIKASSGAVVKKDVKLLPGAQTTAKEEKKEEAKQETGSNAVKEEIKQITLEEAKNKALTDAGLKAAEVTFTKEKADTEDGVLVYEVEFFKDNTEYEYEIDAVSGSIRSKSKETETVVQSQPQQSSQSKQETKTEVKQQPKQETKTEVKQQPKQETKTEVKTAAQPAASSTISVDKAKETATSHAGLKVADVTFSKAKLDNDDGRLEYEIEFFRDGVEYDYTIDAVNGTILECDSEYQEADDVNDDFDDDDHDDDWDDDDDHDDDHDDDNDDHDDD